MKKSLFLSLIFVLALAFSLQTACASNGSSTTPPEQPSAPEEPAELWDVSATDVSHIGNNRRLIAFTFDDGPTEKRTTSSTFLRNSTKKTPTISPTPRFLR